MPGPVTSKITLNPDSWTELPASSIFLLLANLFPLLGVLLWGWDVFPIMLLFWIENIIVGVFFILRILTAGVGGTNKISPIFRVTSSIFFTLHFGIFTLVHGEFVFILFSGDQSLGTENGLSGAVPAIAKYQLELAITAMAISHGFSYYWNYLKNGESRDIKIVSLMSRPYLRVVILHLTVIFGGMVVVALNQPVMALLLLILLKIAIDTVAHLNEHGLVAMPFKSSSSNEKPQ